MAMCCVCLAGRRLDTLCGALHLIVLGAPQVAVVAQEQGAVPASTLECEQHAVGAHARSAPAAQLPRLRRGVVVAPSLLDFLRLVHRARRGARIVLLHQLPALGAHAGARRQLTQLGQQQRCDRLARVGRILRCGAETRTRQVLLCEIIPFVEPLSSRAWLGLL